MLADGGCKLLQFVLLDRLAGLARVGRDQFDGYVEQADRVLDSCWFNGIGCGSGRGRGFQVESGLFDVNVGYSCGYERTKAAAQATALLVAQGATLLSGICSVIVRVSPERAAISAASLA